MHLSSTFIRRPVATTLLSLAVLLAGAVAYKMLPVSSLPEVEFPAISVGAALPGADPETMASAVATPLERQFGRIAGVTQMTSVSQLGATGIVLIFDLNRDINGAARDVQAAINAARSQLPANLPGNPTFRKINPSEPPMIILALTSDTLTVPQMYDAADSILAQKISQVPGVGQVFVGGSAKPAVRVEANPTALNAYGIGLERLRAALGQVNVNRSKGYLSNSKEQWSISATDQLFGARNYAPLIVAYRNGAPVRVRDVARTEDSIENIYTGGLANGKPAILVVIFKTPGANIISTSDAVYAMLPELRASISPAINTIVALDRTQTIRTSIKDVTITMCIAIVLVILVVFVFLRELRATVIPSVAVPLSLLGTFGIMYLFGYTLDNLSLMALTISTGFVVDDAIVVIENITRYLENGMSPFDAAMRGSREIGFTVLSMSLSLIAVFIPILLMGGIVGRLFREFAVTLSAAILVSLVVSLTTTPMLCAKFLEPYNKRSHGRVFYAGERFFQGMLSIYDSGLRWVLRHQPLILLVTVGTFFLNIYLFTLVPKGFFPQQDIGRISGTIQAEQDISFPAMRQKMIDLAAIVQKDPAVTSVLSFIGSGGPGGGSSNTGNMFIGLKSTDQRSVTADQVINRLRPKLAKVPGATLYMQAQQDLRIGGRSTATQYQYTLEDENLEELNTWSNLLLERFRELPELRDVATDQQNQGLLAQLVIDRDTAARLGITPQDIDNTLYDAFGQRQISTTYTQLNQYHVVMEVDQQFQQNPDALRNIYVTSATGTQVPLSAFTHFERKRTALAVNHQGQFPAVTLSFNLAPGVALSDATRIIENTQREMGMPASVHASFQGTAQAFQSSLATEPLLILCALIAVYIVLGMLYESYIHPITILSTLPSAGVGAILALLLFKVELSVIALIGIILLIGIVKKNAILMIDFAIDAERTHGKSSEDAIYEACLLRFRPIMMTTLAALFGAVPLAIGTGTGSELRRPLGITIVGGLIVSQALTLFTTPVVYLFFDKVRLRIAKWRGKPHLEKVHRPSLPEAAGAGD
ncbi:MAG: multidrug efflux RND transporter permease subunit [Acidobacteriaceae bacterium]